MRWVIGIDEAGRGPLAGPISIGAVAMPLEQNDWKFWKVLKDSKQLREREREEWFARMREENIIHAVSLISASVIDETGLTRAATRGCTEVLKQLELEPAEVHILLDWGLFIPRTWKQDRFVKGDERIPAIALASIVAKVTRDRHMVKAHERFPEYGFAQHKGYGTALHYKALAKHGPCTIHRRSFL